MRRSIMQVRAPDGAFARSEPPRRGEADAQCAARRSAAMPGRAGEGGPGGAGWPPGQGRRDQGRAGLAIVFSGRKLGRCMSQDGAEEEARHPWRYGFSRAQLCMVVVIVMAVPAACGIAIGQFELPDAAFALGVGGACAAFTVWDWRRTNERRRRLIRTTGRIASLAASLPRRTD